MPELRWPQLAVVRELAVDPPGREPDSAQAEQHLVLLYADIQTLALDPATDPGQLGQRAGGHDRLRLAA